MTNYIRNSINLIEELSLNAFPSLQTHLYDGWILRFTNGITLRGNSISPLYSGNIEYVQKIAYCEEMFNSHGLPIAYRITENTDKKLDVLLEDNGYKYEHQIITMLCDLSNENCQNTGVEINCELTERWLYSVFKDCSDEKRIITYRAIHSNILSNKIYASIEHNGRFIANGVGIVNRGYVGLFDIGVDEDYRKNGLGYKICTAILFEAQKRGVNKAYIEVNSSNEPAIRLYRKLGSEDYYKYWYRVKR